jgi:hypothetical protein
MEVFYGSGLCAIEARCSVSLQAAAISAVGLFFLLCMITVKPPPRAHEGMDPVSGVRSAKLKDQEFKHYLVVMKDRTRRTNVVTFHPTKSEIHRVQHFAPTPHSCYWGLTQSLQEGAIARSFVHSYGHEHRHIRIDLKASAFLVSQGIRGHWDWTREDLRSKVILVLRDPLRHRYSISWFRRRSCESLSSGRFPTPH